MNLARICPYLVVKPIFDMADETEAQEVAQCRWAAANTRSYWMRWIKGFYFNDQADAFAFLLRWSDTL